MLLTNRLPVPISSGVRSRNHLVEISSARMAYFEAGQASYVVRTDRPRILADYYKMACR